MKKGCFGNCRGSSLLTVMIVVVTASTYLGTVVFAASQRAYMARRLADRVRAIAIAEAGVNKAYSIISTNWSSRTNGAVFPMTNFSYGGGTFTVCVKPVTNNLCVITSTGWCNIADVAVVADCKNYGTSSPGWDSNAFKYAVLCGGFFDFGGSGTFTSTNGTVKLHSNAGIKIWGNANVGGDSSKLDIESAIRISVNNNTTIYGDLFAPAYSMTDNKVWIYPLDDPTNCVVPMVTIPDIDMTPYFTWAQEHNEVKPDGWSPPDGYTPNGGIVWIDGDSGTINGNTFNGSIIASGDVHLSGQLSITPQTNFCVIAVASVTGDIRNQASGTITGLIYAKTGDYVQTANGTFIGQIIVGGTVDKSGCSDCIFFNMYIPTPPGDATGGDDVGISAWQK